MPEGFDPYVQWLDLDQLTRPVTNYQLLGLALYEARTDRIQHAAHRALEKLQPHLKGKFANLAKRLGTTEK